MLTKRIIPCLDVKDGRVVKGVNFLELRDAGDAVELGTLYASEGADELIYLDITATIENRKTFISLVEKLSNSLNIPFTVGGGVKSVSDAAILLGAGADKVTINSAAVRRPELITELSKELGSQAVVVAIDSRRVEDHFLVHVDGGRTTTELEVIQWAKRVTELGAGEIMLTSMDTDGVKSGFDVELTALVSQSINIPVIASGGAGTREHFLSAFVEGKADAALGASVFHFGEMRIGELKSYLSDNKVAVRI